MEYAACAWRAGRGVCRCCLSEGCYKDIATEYYWMGERELYQDMLRECFDLTISYQDGGTNSNSRLICEVCITRLRDASNFKKQVINAEKRFAEHILTGSKLSDITEAAPAATFQEVKLEGVKDETGISDDDDMGADEAATDDPDYDPDYDESDMLPLKFEVQKKEALVEFSFGDEMPTLNTNETTIRRVSKSKGKSPSKKIKMSKKELTIKPIKASGSKVAKVPKAPKPAKVPVKKGSKRGVANELSADSHVKRGVPKVATKVDSSKLIELSNACPFRWYQNQYRCFCCDLTFLEITPLRAHTQSEHNTEQLKNKALRILKGTPLKVDITALLCKLCSLSIQDLTSLRAHLITNHHESFEDETDALVPFRLDLGTFQCQICTETFHGFHNLNQHMNSHFRNYICEVCGAAFSNRDGLSYHKITHRTGKFKCNTCKISFPTVYLKDAHLKREHKKEYVRKCPQCPERFKEHYARLKHMVVVHGAAKTEHRCTSCDKTFPMKFSLNSHIRNVHLRQQELNKRDTKTEFAHKCPQCPERFRQSSQRRTHLETVHGVSPVEHKCESCDKTFVRKSALHTHVRGVHLNDRTHECEVCCYKALHRAELSRHMVTHGAEYKYRCTVCTKGYSRKDTLAHHMKTHDSDNKYPCPICGLSFVHIVSLKQHLRIQHPNSEMP